jgi:hypothetical protein
VEAAEESGGESNDEEKGLLEPLDEEHGEASADEDDFKYHVCWPMH